MGDKTGIEWTGTYDANGKLVSKGATWNPSTGCNKVSPGCRGCYAETLAERLQSMGVERYRNGFKFTMHEDALDDPVRWTRPRRIFVCSMSDLYHESMPEAFRIAIFRRMNKASWHTFITLTKRPELMVEFATKYPELYTGNIWSGVTVEMGMYKPRIDLLRKVPSPIRLLSCEPLIRPLGRMDLSGISWVIAGGESGPIRRPVEAEWIREIRDQCIDQKVAFFFKQWGGPKPGGEAILDGRTWHEFPDSPKPVMEAPA